MPYGLPGVAYAALLPFGLPALHPDLAAEVEARVKYEGYLRREAQRVERLRRQEAARIPSGFDFAAIRALSREGREVLTRYRPETLGQASRLPGVSPADVAVLAVHLGRREG